MEKKSEPDKNHRTTFLFRLTSRGTAFYALVMLSSFLMYVFGSSQQLLDSSQRFILQWCSINAIVLALLSLFGIFLCILLFFVYFKLRYIISIIGYVLTLAFSIVIFLSVYAVVYLSAGM